MTTLEEVFLSVGHGDAGDEKEDLDKTQAIKPEEKKLDEIDKFSLAD